MLSRREWYWQKEVEENVYERVVKDFLESVRLVERMVTASSGAARREKVSPEAARFISRRIDRLIAQLTELKKTMKGGDDD